MKTIYDVKETPLHLALKEMELELTPDGRYIRWANTNPRHPRNWRPLRKAYDIGIIILLEFYTLVTPVLPSSASFQLIHLFWIELLLVHLVYVKLVYIIR